MQSNRLSLMRCLIPRPNPRRRAGWPQAGPFGNDRGSVTIEAAFALAALVIVTALIIGAIATVSAHISALDTASAAARAHAIGVDYRPSGNAQISVQESAGLVTVTAEVPAVFGSRSASAIYPVETR